MARTETTLGAFAHRRSLSSGSSRSCIRTRPAPQSLFPGGVRTAERAPAGAFDFPELTIGRAVRDGRASLDLEFHLWEQERGGLEGYLFYAADLFEAAAVQRIAARYGAILASIVG